MGPGLDVRVRLRPRRRERPVGDAGVALVEVVGEALSVDEHRHRPPHAGVGEGRLLRVAADALLLVPADVGVAAKRRVVVEGPAHRRHLRVGLELVEVVGQRRVAVERAVAEHHLLGRLLLNLLEDEAVHRAGRPPIAGVADQRHILGRRPGRGVLEHVLPAAEHQANALVVLGRLVRLVKVPRHDRDARRLLEVLEVGLVEREPHRARVERFNGVKLGQVGPGPLGLDLGVADPVEGEDDIVGGQRLAVAEPQAVAEAEGHHEAVVADLPGLGELGLELERVGVALGQALHYEKLDPGLVDVGADQRRDSADLDAEVVEVGAAAGKVVALLGGSEQVEGRVVVGHGRGGVGRLGRGLDGGDLLGRVCRQRLGRRGRARGDGGRRGLLLLGRGCGLTGALAVAQAVEVLHERRAGRGDRIGRGPVGRVAGIGGDGVDLLAELRQVARQGAVLVAQGLDHVPLAVVLHHRQQQHRQHHAHQGEQEEVFEGKAIFHRVSLGYRFAGGTQPFGTRSGED